MTQSGPWWAALMRTLSVKLGWLPVCDLQRVNTVYTLWLVAPLGALLFFPSLHYRGWIMNQGSHKYFFMYVVAVTVQHKLVARHAGFCLWTQDSEFDKRYIFQAPCSCNVLCHTLKSTLWLCFTGTGTNVCYMEEVKNIEKTKEIIGKPDKEEREKDKVEEVSQNALRVYFCQRVSCILTVTHILKFFLLVAGW